MEAGGGSPITPSSRLSSSFIPLSCLPSSGLSSFCLPIIPLSCLPLCCRPSSFLPPSSLYLVPHFLHPISPHRFMLSPRSHPLIIILHSHYLFILSTVAPSPCLGSCCLALVCCPLSIVSFPLISHAFHLVPYHFVLASAFFDHVLSVMGGYFLTLLLLGCTAGLINISQSSIINYPKYHQHHFLVTNLLPSKTSTSINQQTPQIA